MKFYQSAAVIALFLSNTIEVNAVQITNSRQNLVQQYSSMKDEELINKINKDLSNPPKLAENKDDAKKTAEEMKIIEEAMGKRVLDRLTGAPQYGHNYGPYGSGDWPYVPPPTPYNYGYPGYPYYYPVGGYGCGDGVAALKAYHDLILGYEAQNAIAGMVHPSVDVVTEALKAATSAGAGEKKEEEKKAATPAAASLLESQESVVLQVNGTPITVNPEIMLKTNTEAATNLGLHLEMGFDDDISVAQKKMTKEDKAELDGMQQRLAQINQKIAKDHTFLQTLPDEPYTNAGGNVATIDGVTVHGMVGNEDLGENSVVGPDPVHYATVKQLNQHKTLPDTPYTNAGGNVATNGGDQVTGMVGDEDLGETSRVGADTVHYQRVRKLAQHQTLPDTPYTNAGGNVATNGGDQVTGMVGNEDLGETSRVGADTVHYNKH